MPKNVHLELFNHRSSLLPEGICLGDNHSLHSCRNGIEGVFDFGNHASCYCAIRHIAGEIIAGDYGDYTVVIIGIGQNTLLLEAEGEGHLVAAGQG